MSEKKPQRIYHTMGEVAEMLDISTTTIRFWESRFPILKPRRNRKGNRLFSPTDLENLKLIYHLVKEQGMTLEGAKKAINDNRDEILRKAEIIERLLGVKAMLLEIKQELDDDSDYTLVDSDADTQTLNPGAQIEGAEVMEEEVEADEEVAEPEAAAEQTSEKQAEQAAENNNEADSNVAKIDYHIEETVFDQTLF